MQLTDNNFAQQILLRCKGFCYSVKWQRDGFCNGVELANGGYVTNRATPPTLLGSAIRMFCAVADNNKVSGRVPAHPVHREKMTYCV